MTFLFGLRISGPSFHKYAFIPEPAIYVQRQTSSPNLHTWISLEIAGSKQAEFPSAQCECITAER